MKTVGPLSSEVICNRGAPAGVVVASCPFCAAMVSQDLVTFGGSCPRCLGAIPGEEAPTDPGEVVKRAQATRDEATARRRHMLPVLVALPVVGLVAVAAIGVLMMPKPEVAVIDFDLLDDFPMPELVARAPGEAPLEGTAPADTRAGTSVGGVAPSVGGAGPSVAASASGGRQPTASDVGASAAVPVDDGSAAAAAAVAVASGDPVARGGTVDLGLSLKALRRSEVYTDPEQITAMIAQLMKAQVPTVQACYERRLRASEGLVGRWRIAYTVTQEGHVRDATATGLDRQDAELESCIVDRVSTWRFDRIIADQPVQRSLRFAPRN